MVSSNSRRSSSAKASSPPVQRHRSIVARNAAARSSASLMRRSASARWFRSCASLSIPASPHWTWSVQHRESRSVTPGSADGPVPKVYAFSDPDSVARSGSRSNGLTTVRRCARSTPPQRRQLVSWPFDFRQTTAVIRRKGRWALRRRTLIDQLNPKLPPFEGHQHRPKAGSVDPPAIHDPTGPLLISTAEARASSVWPPRSCCTRHVPRWLTGRLTGAP